jgi:hypothetical protein
VTRGASKAKTRISRPFESPPSESNRKPLDYKSLNSRRSGVAAGV